MDCIQCGDEAKYLCGRCKKTPYCSNECSLTHKSLHQQECIDSKLYTPHVGFQTMLRVYVKDSTGNTLHAGILQGSTYQETTNSQQFVSGLILDINHALYDIRNSLVEYPARTLASELNMYLKANDYVLTGNDKRNLKRNNRLPDNPTLEVVLEDERYHRLIAQWKVNEMSNTFDIPYVNRKRK